MNKILLVLLIFPLFCLGQGIKDLKGINYSPIVLKASSGGGGSIAEVGGGSQRATAIEPDADSKAQAYPGNVTSGGLLVVAGACWGGTASPTSIGVTDSQGNTYTVTLSSSVSTWRNFIAFAKAGSTGANTVTVNPSGADSTHTFSYAIDEFSGTASSPADVNGGSTPGSDTTPQDDITTVAANALIIGVMSHDGSDMTITPSGNYTQFGESEDNSGNQAFNAVFRIVTTAQAYTVNWIITSANSDMAQTYSFKP